MRSWRNVNLFGKLTRNKLKGIVNLVFMVTDDKPFFNCNKVHYVIELK